MKIIPGTVFGLALVTMLILQPAQAADKKDKAARRMQQMVQQMQQEKAELQAQIDQAKAGFEAEAKKSAQQADSLKGSLSAANRKAGSLAADLQRTAKERSAAEAKLQQTQGLLESAQKSLSELTLQYQNAQRDLKVNEGERGKLVGNLAQKENTLAACVGKNTKLYGFGLELVKMYENPGAFDAVLRKEPFTQIKRVELENIFQDYRDKLDEERAISASK
ncbi:MAG: hypothetical protein HOP04_04285 [Methylophilaceae bacterium]|nr:hypothetical protein [Methylophilaceae bacterium]